MSNVDSFAGKDLLLTGLRAAQKLVQGSKELGVRGDIRQFEKSGGFKDAWTDFYSVKPPNIQEFYTPLGVFYVFY